MADNIKLSEGTAKFVKTDEVSSAHYQEIKLDMGEGGSSLPFTGTIPEISNIADGTVVVGTLPGVGVLADGTVAVGSFDADLPGGTVDKVSSLGTIDGTIESIGTVQKVGTVDRVTRGTLDRVGTIPGIGVVAGGSIVVTTGTIAEFGEIGTLNVLEDGTVAIKSFDMDLPGGTIDLVTRTGKVGTIENLDGGTINIVAGGSIIITDGTIGDMDEIGTINVVEDGTIGKVGTIPGMGVLALGTVKVTEGSADVTALGGTIENLDGGTITSVANVAGGTVQINPKSGGSAIITYGTLADSAGAEFGTISAASGAGTYHYVKGVAITVLSGTVDCFVGYGSLITGTNVIARGQFPEGGGIARSFTPSPLAGSGTNTELIYKNGGAGTVMYIVDFWRGT